MPSSRSPASTSSHASAEAGILTRSRQILWRTIKAFFEDNVTRLGAALAFYTTIAVAPLLVLSIAVAGLVLDDSSARETIITEITSLTGAPAGETLRSIENPMGKTEGITATVIGVGTLLFGAFGVFHQLQEALNVIWHVESAAKKENWKELLKRRLFSLMTVITTGFLLLVSLVVSAGLSWFGNSVVSHLSLPVLALQVVTHVLSFLVITFLFALIFKLLPDATVRWRHVWLGAAVTAALFTLGKIVLGVYLAHARITSAYGAAGSIIALLLWCYYAAQILFFGAEFTRIASRSHGGRDYSLLDRKER